MSRVFQEQIERIDRLLQVIEADNPSESINGLSFYDCTIFACQCMWHLKDWILSDETFGAKDKTSLKADIHAAKCLLVCADIANGSKHLKLNNAKVGASISNQSGIHIDPTHCIFHEFYYVICEDERNRFHGMEIRELLRECRDTWEGIINKHYLSVVVIT